MSDGYDLMRARLEYYGGIGQQNRMIKDKLRSLKAAMQFSYQAGTLEFEDGRQFRCLINQDKTKTDYDDKILSIPFEDVRFNADSRIIEPTGIKTGVIFKWVETNTYWLVYLQNLEELAYFHGEIRRCDYELDMDGRKQRVSARGPEQVGIDWVRKSGILINNLNYTLALTLPLSEENKKYFERHKKIKFLDKTWEVQATHKFGSNGTMDVYIKEYYTNSIAEAVAAEKEEEPALPQVTPGSPHIEGESTIYPYDTRTYSIINAEGGSWRVDSSKIKILSQDSSNVTIQVNTGRSGTFNLIYTLENEDISVLPIVISSL